MTSVFPQPGSQVFTLTMTPFPDWLPRCKKELTSKGGGACINFFPELPIWFCLACSTSLTQNTAVVRKPVAVQVCTFFHTTTMASSVFTRNSLPWFTGHWPWAYSVTTSLKSQAPCSFTLSNTPTFIVGVHYKPKRNLRPSWVSNAINVTKSPLGWPGSSSTYLYSQ